MRYDNGAVPTVVKNIGSIKKTCRISSIIGNQVIGHTRKATTGKITQANAHPFIHGDIIGSHNGFVYQHEKLNTQFNRDFSVDSQHLIAHIAEGKPLAELDGIGTVSYLNVRNPKVVFLGRGTSSDLVVYGLGPREKPIGIVWCSVGFWATEALEMAGFSDNFPYQTHLRKLYKVVDYDLIEHSDFDFGATARTYTPTQSDYRDFTRCSSGFPNHGYRGRTMFDSEQYNPNKGGCYTPPTHIMVSKHDLDQLPESLKKNQELIGDGQREDQKAHEATQQCTSCNDWGRLVTHFESDADGIMYFPSIDQTLCCECALYWGQETGQSTKLAVPHLKLTLRKGGIINRM